MSIKKISTPGNRVQIWFPLLYTASTQAMLIPPDRVPVQCVRADAFVCSSFRPQAPGSISSHSFGCKVTPPGWILLMPQAWTHCPLLPSRWWALWDPGVAVLVTVLIPSCSFLCARHPKQAGFGVSLSFPKLPKRIPSQHSQCICLVFQGLSFLECP